MLEAINLMKKYFNFFFFLLGIALFLLGFFCELFIITITLEGYVFEGHYSKDLKLGAITVGFLISPFIVCGFYLIKSYRPKKTKKIELSKIFEIFQKKGKPIIAMDLVLYLRLSITEATNVLKKMNDFGLIKINENNYGYVEYILENFSIKSESKTPLLTFMKSLILNFGKFRIYISLILIFVAFLMLMFSNEDNFKGNIIIIIFSFLCLFTSLYITWYRENKNKVCRFIEI